MRKDFSFYFDYDKENGRLFWRETFGPRTLKGREVGYVHQGYRKVELDDKAYLVHRIIWWFEHGSIPGMLDHINGNGLDNRIENLRASSKRANGSNLACHRAGKLVGASLLRRKLKKPWLSSIWINKKCKKLGYFATEVEAHNAYEHARSLLEQP